MKSPATVLLLSTLAWAIASSAEMGWRDKEGRPVPNSPDQKVVNGFGGWVIVTPDEDWEEKWNTPTENTPAFATADEVVLGKSVTILVFFASPKVDTKRNIKVSCDLVVTRPNGSKSIDEKHMDCASGPLRGAAENLRLTNLVVKFVGEPNDPPGKWVVDVTVRDEVAKVSVPLQTYFTLKGPSG